MENNHLDNNYEVPINEKSVWEYEYYEMYLGDKNNFELIKNEYDNAELMEEVFKIIFTEIYKGGKGPRFIKNTDGKVGGQDKIMGKCLLF